MHNQSNNSSDRLSILDVTLRDGGYRDNWSTSAEDILEVVLLMQELGIDFVELGYASDSGRYGDNGTLTAETLAWVRKHVRGDIKLAVMLFQDEPAPVEVLNSRRGLFDLVRIPLRCERLAEAYPILDYCTSYDVPFSANLTRVSAYPVDELLKTCDELCRHRPQYIYLADSRGALLPTEVSDIFEKLTSEWPNQAFGFHAHNNLSLALANSLAAKHAGASIVDASLAGCGLGAGNLAFEHLLGVRYRNDTTTIRRVIEVMSEKQELLRRLDLISNYMAFSAGAALNVSQETVVGAAGDTSWIDRLP